MEGANILTRSLMIFGQGATRCHPYVLKEMAIAGKELSANLVAEFDSVLFDHAGFFFQNGARSLVHGLTGSNFTGILIDSPAKRYYQHLERLSAAFVLVADAAMLTMQSSLKKREMLSARLGDLLSMLYLASMVLKHYENDGCPAEDMPVVDWCCQYLLNGYQQAMHGILQNFPSRPVAWLLRGLVFPLGRRFNPPADILESRLANLISRNTPTRDRLIAGIYLTAVAGNPVGSVEEVFHMALEIEPLQQQVRNAARAGTITAITESELIDAAEQAGVVNAAEATRLKQYNEKMMEVIHVDEFPYEAFSRAAPAPRRTVKKRAKKKQPVKRRNKQVSPVSPDRAGN